MAEGTGLLALYTTQFSTNLELFLQQMESKLRGKVTSGSYVGKQASPVQYMNALQYRAPAGRFAPLNRTDADFQRRWVFPQDKEIDHLIDTFDQLRTLVDPKSQVVSAFGAAAGRVFDDCLITAATASAQIGQDAAGLSSESFDTAKFQIASTFGSSAASGMTVAKMIEAKRILRKYHNDMEAENFTFVIGSQGESDLLNQMQVVSTDFNDKPVLVEGKIVRFMGFDIVVSERLNLTDSVTRGALAFSKSGLHLGIWSDMQTNITQRTDLSSQPWQIYSKLTYGATRLQPGKVLQILCADTTGADITP